jgi:hypothetical protein
LEVHVLKLSVVVFESSMTKVAMRRVAAKDFDSEGRRPGRHKKGNKVPRFLIQPNLSQNLSDTPYALLSQALSIQPL